MHNTVIYEPLAKGSYITPFHPQRSLLNQAVFSIRYNKSLNVPGSDKAHIRIHQVLAHT